MVDPAIVNSQANLKIFSTVDKILLLRVSLSVETF